MVHVGPLPPPLGGISVYLYRLSRIEEQTEIIDENQFRTQNQFWLWIAEQFFNPQPALFVYHSPSLKRRMAFFMIHLLTHHKFAIVSHGNGLENSYNRAGRLKRLLIRKMLSAADYIQVVNPLIAEFINSININPSNLFVRNAFLPPPVDDEEKIIATYPNDLLNFIESHQPLIIANAFRLVFHNGLDLYGLDMCIELVDRLKNEFAKVGLIFALADDNANNGYLIKSKHDIEKRGLKDHFSFLTEQREIWPLFKKADLMVRPTSTDGYGISIAEALYFGCPAIASDVCERPSGSILFISRNLDDFYLKAYKILTKNCKGRLY